MEKRKSSESNDGEATEPKRSRPTSISEDNQDSPNKENSTEGQPQEAAVTKEPVEDVPPKPSAKRSLPSLDEIPSTSKCPSDDKIAILKDSTNCIASSEELIRKAPSLEDLSPEVLIRHTWLASRERVVPTENAEIESVPGSSTLPVEPPTTETPEAGGDHVAPEPKPEPSTGTEETAEKPSPQQTVTADQNQNTKMGELSDAQLQMLVSDLQLQLNAAQQDKASLELEIRQKEEVVLKTQVQAQKNDAALKQEIKQLKEKLKEKSKISEEDCLKDLEKGLKEAKEREAKAMAELNNRHAEDDKFSKTLVEYEENYQKLLNEFEKLKDEHMLTAGHLASLESAFSDLLRKYERSKASVNQLKSREDSVNFNIDMAAENVKKAEARYESLKTYAQAQIEKCNKEILSTRDRYEGDNSKLKAIVKRLEIKCNSLDTSLQQKNKECLALSELCDHITSNQVQSTQY